ncbi:MAG: carbamoyltransferase [Fluviicola sp.]|nr:carbamoyltransferase [Fluviicola sp.]
MKKILGISAFYHDSAAAIVVGGEIIAAAQEERFTRKKHTPDFPENAIIYCLEEAGLSIDELDAIVFYDKPFIKFERLLETYYSFSPKGIFSFLKAIPVWIKEKLFLRKMIIDGLKEIEKFDKKKVNLLFTEHHLSHAASAFFASNFKESAILTIDGVGEWCTSAIGKGEKNSIVFEKELHFPHSVGLLYSAFTYYLGFTVNSGEYKVMGLAPYGNPDSEQTKQFIELIKTKLIEIKEDGSIWMDQSYFNYLTGLRMIKEKKWEALFDLARRDSESELEQSHCNMAYAIQQVTEEIVIKMAREAKRIAPSDNLCLAGGVALNCVANGRLLREKIFKNIYIQTASGDAGGALGAALSISFMYYGEERSLTNDFDAMKGSYLGPEFSDKEIIAMAKKQKAAFSKQEDFSLLAIEVAKKIAEGKVVGWFQGRMEFGPRALGNRSILGDASNPEMQKKINLKIKYREGFRPFAPSVLAEDASKYFDLEEESPHMLLVAPVKEHRRLQLPEDYHELNLKEKLYCQRSDIQAVTHLDFSARIQTVHKDTNPRYWELINEVKKQTENGLVLNTSFNVRGEPIVCSPYDAYRCFMSTEMDVLVINDFLFIKEKQINFEDRDSWKTRFKND